MERNRIRFFQPLTLIAVAATILLSGCGPAGSGGFASAPRRVTLPAIDAEPDLKGDGVTLLKEVLDTYADLRSYQSTVAWEMVANDRDRATSERLVFLEMPNRYRVEAITGSLKFSSVSDGKTTLEQAGQNAKLTWSAPNIWTAEAENIRDFQLAGSMLFDFFAGRPGLEDLVDASAPVQLVPGAAAGKQQIRFSRKGRYGTTTVTVDAETRQIERIQAQFEPMVQESSQLPRDRQLTSFVVTETFANVRLNAPIGDAVFATRPPEGARLKDERTQEEGGRRNLLTAGMQAPDFQLPGLDGKTVSLSSLRGSVVLLDFWATWCLGCRDSLALSVTLHETFAKQGLSVWAVHTLGEDMKPIEDNPDAINVFLRQEGLTGLPVLMDSKGAVKRRFSVVGLPTSVVIDRAGNVEQVFFGVPDAKEMLRALRSAGLELDASSEPAPSRQP